MSYLKIIKMLDKFPESTYRWQTLDIIAGEASMYEMKIERLVEEATYYANGPESESQEYLENIPVREVEVKK